MRIFPIDDRLDDDVVVIVIDVTLQRFDSLSAASATNSTLQLWMEFTLYLCIYTYIRTDSQRPPRRRSSAATVDKSLNEKRGNPGYYIHTSDMSLREGTNHVNVSVYRHRVGQKLCAWY